MAKEKLNFCPHCGSKKVEETDKTYHKIKVANCGKCKKYFGFLPAPKEEE
ncbi:MAG: hypothetical protein NE327_06365 [Lentisphaeraceae bacterium]|nr:hypothetical protein [Lentisphaeraceae bacterium]